MSNLHWFILAAIVIAGIAYWNHQRSQAQVAQLQSSGFNISDNLKGNPNLLVSRSQRQIAVPKPSGYVRFGFDQVRGSRVISESAPEHDYNHRLSITVVGQDQPVNVGYADQAKADKALKQLEQILSN